MRPLITLPSDALRIAGTLPYFNGQYNVALLPEAPSRIRLAQKHGYGVIKHVPPVPPIVKMASYLLPHQQQAVRRLWNGGVLADAPRMGKTVTAIGWAEAHAEHDGNDVRCLIICPALLIKQWNAHIQKFGTPRVQYTVVSMDSETFPGYSDLCVIDEGRHFKKSKTKRHGKVSRIIRRKTLVLEATPFPDYVQDLFGLLHLVRPDWFPSARQFEDVYIWKHGRVILPNEALLREDVADLMVWRKKEYSRDLSTVHYGTEELAMEQLKSLPRPLVVFTDTRERVKRLSAFLGAQAITGQNNMRMRTEVVNRFQGGEVGVLVSTFWAAGEGVDLSNAKSCAIFGYDWTPGTITQSIARTDHIDPKREKAHVHCMLWPGSADKREAWAHMKSWMVPDWAEVVTL